MNDPCRIFEEELLDLVYDELGEAESEKLRMHATSCDRCRAALENALMVRKLASRIPEDGPDDSMDEILMSEAIRYAENRRDSFESSNPQEPAPITLKARIPEKQNRFWVPAFAAAALAASVAVVSIVLIQDADKMEADHAHAPDMVAVKSEEPPPAGAPSLGPPAKSTPFSQPPQASPQVERLEEETAKEPPKELSVASRLGTSAGPPPKKSSSRGRFALGFARDDGDTPAPVDQLSKKRAKRSSRSTRSEAAGQKAPKGLQRPKAKAPMEFAESAAASGSVDAASARVLTSPDSNSGVSFEEAEQALRRGDCQTAIAGFTPWAERHSDPQKSPKALIGLARCESRRGRCSRAVLWYRRLLDGYPSHPSRPSLLWEAATCERKLGRVEQAKKYLKELTRFPNWRQRAETQLLELGN